MEALCSDYVIETEGLCTAKLLWYHYFNFFPTQDGDIEPVESLPYFHSCLSKEDAVEKLMRGW